MSPRWTEGNLSPVPHISLSKEADAESKETIVGSLAALLRVFYSVLFYVWEPRPTSPHPYHRPLERVVRNSYTECFGFQQHWEEHHFSSPVWPQVLAP